MFIMLLSVYRCLSESVHDMIIFQSVQDDILAINCETIFQCSGHLLKQILKGEISGKITDFSPT